MRVLCFVLLYGVLVAQSRRRRGGSVVLQAGDDRVELMFVLVSHVSCRIRQPKSCFVALVVTPGLYLTRPVLARYLHLC